MVFIARVDPTLKRDPSLLFERMCWRRRKGRTIEALKILKRAPRNLVRADLWSREREIIARWLLTEGRITDAHRAIVDHRVTEKNRARFAEAEWLTGWIELRHLNGRAPLTGLVERQKPLETKSALKNGSVARRSIPRPIMGSLPRRNSATFFGYHHR